MMMLADDKRLEKLRRAVEKKHQSRIKKGDPVAQVVADFYGISLEEILDGYRPKDIYWARSVSYYLMRQSSNASLRKIARRMGGKCSSKVHYAIKSVIDRITKDPDTAKEIEILEKKIRELQ